MAKKISKFIADGVSHRFDELKEENKRLRRQNSALREALTISRHMTDELRQDNKEMWKLYIELQDYIKNNFIEGTDNAPDRTVPAGRSKQGQN